MPDAREIAVKTLLEVDRGAWSDVYLSSAIKKAGLDRRDAGFCTALCAGVLQNRALIDFYIGTYSSLGLNKIAPAVLCILRTAVYQIAFMDRVPPSAAVNTAVSMARKLANPRAGGFVNAVLRRVAENAKSLPLPDRQDEDAYLSLRYSHPRWLVEVLRERLGTETEALLHKNNEAPSVTLRVNTLKATLPEVLDRMHAQDLAVLPHPFLDTALELEKGGSIEQLDVFREGFVTVQDAASQMCVLALDPRPGERVLDLCSAPGGKAFAAAVRMGNKGQIMACDLYPKRLDSVVRDAARLGITCIETAKNDAAVYTPDFEAQFQRVLVDAPCSGMGIIRKKPEIRYKDEEQIRKLPQTQLAILKNAARYLKNDGIMVYSTCSILKEENEAVVSAFISSHPEFAPVDFELPGGIQSEGGMLTLWPHVHGTDGFFIAKLQKRS